MSEEKATDMLKTIISVDIKDYGLRVADDDIATSRILKEHREIISHHVQKYAGHVLDSQGNNALAEFSSAVDAVLCACKIQREVARKNDELPESRKIDFRIGIHIGDVVEEREHKYSDIDKISAHI